MDDAGALALMQALLDKATITMATFHLLIHLVQSKLSTEISLDSETYQMLINQDNFIDRVNCYVGITSLCQMLRGNIRLYSQTIHALITGMRDRRWVEFYYHGSSGTEGDSSKK